MEGKTAVDVSDFDLRYESYRIRNRKTEERLLLSILKVGIREPLRGVEGEKAKILLDGFKRLRCARKLNIEIVPYVSMSDDQAMGIVELIRGSFSKGLDIVEQAKLIDELKNVYGMSIAEIADRLERSKAWVGLRAEMTNGISQCVLDSILAGRFPARSYLYTIAPLTRVNGLKKEDVDRFVNLVSGKGISTRDLDLLARAYFAGSDEIVDQMNNGNLEWGLKRLKEKRGEESGGYTQFEGKVLKRLETIGSAMGKLIVESGDKRLNADAFLVQANILAEAIRNQMGNFSKAIGRFYDRSG
ncbi:MAG: chromosome partitioning protein ParB [Proteobacteria bacterium]|nr:chromosome partitioning protein ParB [Pseudomonadota bacterium]